MKAITPRDIIESTLTASDVPANDYAVWTAGTYALGDERQQNLVAYRSLTGGNTDSPEDGVLADPPTWLRLGYINRWKMFRDGTDSKTVQEASIEVDLTFDGIIDSIALFGLEGTEATVTVTDSTEGQVYQQSKEITEIGVLDWWEFFFLSYDTRQNLLFDDLPSYPEADITVQIISPTGTDAACGRLVAGNLNEIGITEYGTSVGNINYGTRTRDGFGNLVLEPKRVVRLVNFSVRIPTRFVSSVAQTLDNLADIPTAFVGSDTIDATIIFGVYRDFRINFSNPALSDTSIEVEGF
jgi:hypothetical protein